MTKALRNSCLAAAWICAAHLAPATRGELLYDATFSSPIDVVGQPAAIQSTGTPRFSPTYDRFGDSRVVSAFGGLLDQPLQLVPTSVGPFNYAQLQFDIGSTSFYGFPVDYRYYHIGMDVFLDHFDANDTFSLLFDVPGAVRLDLSGDGTITQPRPAADPVVLAEVPFGTALALAADINLPGNQWTISVNSQPIYTGQFFYSVPANLNPPGSLFSFRINLSDDPSTPHVPDAAIDNIVVTGTIPEPDALMLEAGAVLSLLVASRRMRLGVCVPGLTNK